MRIVKTFNSFYGELSVMNETDLDKRNFRLALIAQMAGTLKKGMKLLGIDVPERM
jgi:arginyl-tRNA synthetase